MKKNMLATMNKLEIDDGIRSLIKQLWGHCYKTEYSCEGHDERAYVMFSGGDGWFEKNAFEYGLKKVPNNICCETQTGKCCGTCGAGINGNFIYGGKLI